MRLSLYLPSAQSFPFTSIKHNIITLDVQGTAAGLIILVTGHLIVGFFWLTVWPECLHFVG
jgi:hypothetical protein